MVTFYSNYTRAMTFSGNKFSKKKFLLRPVIEGNTGKRREMAVLRRLGRRRLSWLQAMVRCSWCSWVEWRGVCVGVVCVSERECERD